MITNQLSERNSFWRYNIYWLLWLVLISYLSNRRSEGLPEFSFLQFQGVDKVVHAVFYSVLTFLIVFGLKKQHVSVYMQFHAFSYAAVISLVWGALMELSQLYIFTYRSAESLDLMANATGTFFALVICSLFIYNRRKI